MIGRRREADRFGLGPRKGRVAAEAHFAEEAGAAVGDGGRLGDPNVVLEGPHWELGRRKSLAGSIIGRRGGVGIGVVVGVGSGARTGGGADNAIEGLVEALVFVFFLPSFAHRLVGSPI